MIINKKVPSRSLFKQYNPEGTEDINEWRIKFVEACDPTEYQGALAVGLTWAEWKAFKESWPFFAQKILPEWLDEIDVVIRSESVKALIEAAIHGGNTPSAKWVAEGKYNPTKNGRPTKEQLKRETKKQQKIQEAVHNDLERLETYIKTRNDITLDQSE